MPLRIAKRPDPSALLAKPAGAGNQITGRFIMRLAH
jgi:hypothetical protein